MKLVVMDTSAFAHIAASRCRTIPHDSAEARTYSQLCIQWFSNLGWLRCLAESCNDVRVLWAVDSKPYWRSKIEPNYKMNRKPKPPETVEFVRYFCQHAASRPSGVAVYGFEADDIAAAVVRMWRSKQASGQSTPLDHIYLCTVDSDWLGLVGDGVTWLNPAAHVPRVREEPESYNWLLSQWKRQSKKRQKWWAVPNWQDYKPGHIWQWKSVVGDRADGLKAGSDIGLIDLLNPLEDILKVDNAADGIRSAVVNAEPADFSCIHKLNRLLTLSGPGIPCEPLVIDGLSMPVAS